MTAIQDQTTAASGLKYRRIVAKCGTNLLTGGSDRLNPERMAAIVGQVARLHAEGAEVILVTSGAIAAGRHRLGVRRDRRGAAFRQVLAAIGQSHLMQSWDQLFDWHDIVVAQTLLTRRDLADRGGYLNARNTLLAILELGVVPIVNENDVVALDEIRETKIGDNDNLSAQVANLVDADLLANLTSTGGLYTADPNLDPTARLIERVDRIDAEIERIAGGAVSDRAIGGMVTKIQAARLATASGVDVFIASGAEPDVLVRLARGEHVGTYFPATVDRVESRRRFLLSGLSVKGEILVDAGAVRALREQGRSLLAAGVRDVRGIFERGETVRICSTDGTQIACGITNYGASDLNRIKGLRSDRIAAVLGYAYGDEVVHRNNLVLT
jgi:glutamate 5-kinase